MHHPIIIGGLLAAAVILCLLCAVGLVVVRDAYQQMQFCGPVGSIAMPLLAVAVWVADPDWQSRIKAALIAAILITTNSVLSHATARAIRIRQTGQWPMAPQDHLPIVNQTGKVVGTMKGANP